jgi:hypothetical protein
VRYVSQPLGIEGDYPRDSERRLVMVFDGKSVCMQDWGADGEPPLGFTKRVYHTLFLWAPAVKQQDLQKDLLFLKP